MHSNTTYLKIILQVVRLESRKPGKKRFMAVVENDTYHSLIIGIDWENEGNPTIGLVLPISNSTESK